ncbi:MAG: hypothetical protein Q8O56_05650 [Solirubrobacteraceae bacterium]|nr:hypothetical protein [Solirubrobacteraceae bacterium]
MLAAAVAVAVSSVGCGGDEPRDDLEGASFAVAIVKQGSPQSIEIVEVDGTRRRIGRGGAPAWSSDGSRIGWLQPGPDKDDDGHRIRGLATATPAGGDRRLVPPPGHARGPLGVEAFDWSPSGTMIASEAAVQDGLEPPRFIYVARPDGADRRTLARCQRPTAPAFSPDGDSVAHLCDDARGQVRVADVDGRRSRTLYDVGSLNARYLPSPIQGQIAWRPDGRQMAVGVTDIVRSQDRIAFIDSDDGRLRPGPVGARLRWSSDGRRYAYQSDRDVVIRDAVGDRFQRRLRGATSFAWSPDGRYLAFSALRGDTLGGIRIIRVRDGRSAGSIRLPGAVTIAWRPAR